MLFPYVLHNSCHFSCTASPVNPKNVYFSPSLYKMLHAETIKLLKVHNRVTTNNLFALERYNNHFPTYEHQHADWHSWRRVKMPEIRQVVLAELGSLPPQFCTSLMHEIIQNYNLSAAQQTAKLLFHPRMYYNGCLQRQDKSSYMERVRTQKILSLYLKFYTYETRYSVKLSVLKQRSKHNPCECCSKHQIGLRFSF